MKRKSLLKIGILCTLIATGTGIGFAIAKNNTPLKVEAAQYLDDYAPYTYTGNYYERKEINFSASQGMDGELRRALSSKIKPEAYYSYSGTGSSTISYALQYADEDPNNSNNMIYLYTRNSVAKNAASSWNREHVWCQSLSNNNWGKSQGGTDVLHLRPTYQSTNSSRGNTPYGEVANRDSHKKTYNSMLYGYCANGNEYFEPIDQVKGDVARTVMYLWVTYNNTSKPLSITSVFKDFDTLLRWHTNDRPDLLEGHRNDWCEQQSKQKNRNPFVDHPELAWKIFGDQASSSVKAACMSIYPDGGTTTPVEPTGITINKTTANLKVNDTLQLTATLQPNGATGSITWTSSDTDVATVSSAGLVTAKAVGTATITAKYSNSIKAECEVTVTESGGGQTPSVSVASSISSGDVVILGAEGADLKTQLTSISTTSTKYGIGTDYTNTPNTALLTLDVVNGSTQGTYAFKLKSGTNSGKYLYWTSGNSLNVDTNLTANTSWNVTFDDGFACIKNASDTARQIWWNVDSPRFACYTGKNAGDAYYATKLWKINEDVPYVFNLDNCLNDFETTKSLHGSATTSGEANTNSLILSESGLENETPIDSLTIGNTTIVGNKGSHTSGLVPKYYTSGFAIRVYVGNTLTFTSTIAMSRIEFSISQGESGFTASVGDLSNGVWTGSASTIVFTNSGSQQVRITSISITTGVQTTTIDSVSLKFGASVPKSTWDEIAENCTINDYGMMLVKKNTLDNVYQLDTIEEAFDEELPLAAVSMGSGDTPFENGDNYVFKASVTISNYETEFYAAPFIVLDDEYHFLTQINESAKNLAGEYLDNHIETELSTAALKIIAGRA